MRFAHLSARSSCSFLRGASTVEHLCEQAARAGMERIALTDINGLYGAIPFLRAASVHGLSPIFGVDLREPEPAPPGREPAPESPRSRRGFVGTAEGDRGESHGRLRGKHSKPDRPGSALLIAQSSEGYSSLCQLVTDRHLKHNFILKQALVERGPGVVVLTGDLDLLEGLVRARGAPDHYLALGAWQPWRMLWSRARQRGMPAAGVRPVATGEVWFAEPADHRRHHLLTAIGLNTSLPGVPRQWLASPEAWLKGPEEIERIFADLPEAVRNAAQLAQRCSGGPETGVLRLPRYSRHGVAQSGGDALDHLRTCCLKGVVWRYGTRTRPRRDGGPIPTGSHTGSPWADRDRPVPVPADLPERVVNQLEHELSIIGAMGYADYFLVVADIVRFARRRGIPTCGRGSAANSVVAYVLGLTHVDPLAHDLYFERFLNPERSDAPDVDLDFSWRDRDRVLDYVYRRYGADRVAMIATLVTFQARAAVREVAKVHGLPEGEIAAVTRRLGYFQGARELRERIAENPRFKGIDLTGEPWQGILQTAGELDGFPRHLGVHPGGIVIAPDPLTRWLPLERSSRGVVVTQWDMYPVEEIGLVKIDLLGNRSLAVIDDTCRQIKQRHGRSVSYLDSDPADDEAVQRLLSRGETVGCFYIESPATRALLRKLACRDFDTLVAASSIIRPGIASSGMMDAYIERYHGVPFTYLHPQMEELLGSTFGVMCYQEDVIKVAHHIAGLSLADADGLRKSMSKKRNYEQMAAYRRRFIEGARGRGVVPEVAEELWRQVESFGGYSFCKAHSASYARVSFRAAWLKAHYPAEFMAAVLSNHGGFYTTIAYISEAVRLGLRLLGPDLNQSEQAYTGCTVSPDSSAGAPAVPLPGSLTAPDDWGRTGGPARGWLRVGLDQVRGLRAESARALVVARQGAGPFAGLEDLVARVALQPAELTALIRCGALDGLKEGNRSEQMWRALAWEHARTVEGMLPLVLPDLPAPPAAAEHDRLTRLAFEAEELGFLVSAHPLAPYRDRLARLRAQPGPEWIAAADLSAHIGERVRVVGWMVTAKPIRTSAGELMEFLSFEDTTALYEATAFPHVYRRYASRLTGRGPFLLTGRIEQEWGVAGLVLERLQPVGTGELPASGWTTGDRYR